MLEQMRKLSDKKIFQIILALVVGSFVIAGVGDIFKDISSGIVAIIDKKHHITLLDFKRSLKNEIARIENEIELLKNMQ